MLPQIAVQLSPQAGAALGAGVIVGIIIVVLLFVAIAILLFIFWLWMLIDCIKRDFKNDMEKVVWILLMVFLGALASAIYYFVVYREAKKRGRS
ncbi:MAG TPA: PLDc N-terminal domain-containing protein [Candidatus Nanoarchaeia archaeon]|nr:PLDc N-terminal domain-containing protein [Candidatus Nanoarchaeia archaeon]